MKISIKKHIQDFIILVTLVAGVIAIISLFLKHGFYLSDKWIIHLLILDEIIAVIFVISLIIHLLFSENKWQYIRQAPFEFILLAVFIISIILEEIFVAERPHDFLKGITLQNFISLYFVLIQIYIIISAVLSLAKAREKWLFFTLSPARIIMLSYFIVIMLGALLLKLPKATYSSISFIDALFTSTSAVCVTGLSTINISEVYTFEGQLFILILIQIGGLGIITLTSFVALFIHRGIRLKDQIIVQEVFSDENFSSLTSILKIIVLITFITELAGATALYFSWGNLGLSESERIFSSVFHGVSAYCNAGFSIFPQGLETTSFHLNAISLIIIMLLIVCGGLGFYTYADIFGIGEAKIIRRNGLTLQSKIIVFMTLMLIVGGALLIWIFEIPQWKELPFGKQVLNSFFLSIASRTAGYSICNIGNLTIPALMIVILLMYIGAAPNSSAGGIKVTTGMILLASFRAFVKGKNRVEVGWNTISMITVRRAYIVLIVSMLLIFFALLVLSLTENHSFFDLLFEIVSAFGTVGLSRGITPELTSLGKLMIILVMYSGRIGLFTLAIAASQEEEVDTYHFPEINLMVG